MRVVHVISGIDPENGGPTFALVGLAEAQVRAGLDVTVIATWQIQSGFPLAERMRQRGVKVQHIGQARGKLSTYPGLADIVDRAVAESDVIHIHALWEQMQHDAARSAQKRGTPYIITPHGMLAPWSRAQGSLINRWGKRFYLATRLRKNLDRAAAIHFTTTSERDLVAPMRFRPPTIIEPVGIDLAEFEPLPARGAFRKRYDRVGERPMILFLSRLSPQKGLDRLIPAFARFAQQNPDAVLVLAGPYYEGYRQTINRLIEQSGVKDRIVLTGMLHGRERIEAMVDADLFVLPSHHENFGIVVAEAMAAGTAAIVSREVNIFREVEEAGAGTVTEGNVAQLADLMRQWMSDPSRRQIAGQKGREFALSHYNWDMIAGHWKAHYAQLATGAH